tara:strand:+ start:377 stop:814 length:438 start_codon:yes stop_codon:yes gene_type:complete
MWLMMKVAECLQNSTLKDIEPTKDWKHAKRRNLFNYYVVASVDLLDCACCLRLLHNTHVLIIEYMFTVPEARSRGIGTSMVNFCKSICAGRPMHVISTEEAVVYWMNCGFIWEQDNDTEDMNEFDDTYLLTYHTPVTSNPSPHSL